MHRIVGEPSMEITHIRSSVPVYKEEHRMESLQLQAVDYCHATLDQIQEDILLSRNETFVKSMCDVVKGYGNTSFSLGFIQSSFVSFSLLQIQVCCCSSSSFCRSVESGPRLPLQSCTAHSTGIPRCVCVQAGDRRADVHLQLVRGLSQQNPSPRGCSRGR